MNLQIFKNNTSNVNSVVSFIDRMGLVDTEISVNTTFERDNNVVILPGVSSFDPYIEQLTSSGMTDRIINQGTIKVLGICAGAQVLFEGSDEGCLPGLRVFAGMVEKINQVGDYKIPHVGWNKLILNESHPYVNLFENINLLEKRFYFSHSYCMPDSEHVLAYVDYGYKIPAIVAKENFFAIQFHPEKSYRQGANLIRNILQYEDS